MCECSKGKEEVNEIKYQIDIATVIIVITIKKQHNIKN